MHPVANHLKKLLSDAGWHIVRRDEPDAWWADECWHLSRSRDSVVLTYLVDPQADVHRRKKGEAIWAVKASAAVPSRWQSSAGEAVLDLGPQWHERAIVFVRSLDRLSTKEPNKAPEPTPGAVMPRATGVFSSEAAFREARGTPAPGVAHL